MTEILRNVLASAKLAEKLRALADAGNFSHLSIISNGKGYHASFSPASTWGRGMGDGADPVEAVLMAIERAPKGPKNRGNEVHPPAADKSNVSKHERPRAVRDTNNQPQA